MTGNYGDYTLLKNDVPEEECRGWFWATLGEDNVYPRELLQYLTDLCDRIDRGEEKLIPVTTDMMDHLVELVNFIEDDNETD